jgi:ubiquinol-cytochrome c reductase cytochrome c1 subunit
MLKNLVVCSLLSLASLVSLSVQASTEVHLDKAPINIRDAESVQRGAQIFVSNCLSCHSASMMRYNRLLDTGLNESQIKKYFMPKVMKDGQLVEADNINGKMTIALKPEDAAKWLGVAPPDLTLVARVRGADWLYTYFRSFYRDEKSATGWNNLIFDKVAMPHVLSSLQGVQVLETLPAETAGHADKKELRLATPGSLTIKTKEGLLDNQVFDKQMADLTNYLVFMGDPGLVERQKIGYWVLLFLLLIMLPLSYFLKKEYWRDIH